MTAGSVVSRLCRWMSHVVHKLLDFVSMRRAVSRLINRALLGEPLPPLSVRDADVHTHGHRRALVVGLGNPGLEGTRHSVGMAVLSALAARLGSAHGWRGDKQVSGEVIVSETPHTQVVLLRPKLLMNLNGVSVAKAARKYSIQPEHILLVHDELDKPLGKIAIKHGGSARGHNGVRSCVDCLQTDVMPRLRVGIGRPVGGASVERHVLGHFSQEEKKVLGSVLERSVVLLLDQLHGQFPSSPAGGAQKRKEGERSGASPGPAQS